MEVDARSPRSMLAAALLFGLRFRYSSRMGLLVALEPDSELPLLPKRLKSVLRVGRVCDGAGG